MGRPRDGWVAQWACDERVADNRVVIGVAAHLERRVTVLGWLTPTARPLPHARMVPNSCGAGIPTLLSGPGSACRRQCTAALPKIHSKGVADPRIEPETLDEAPGSPFGCL